MKPRPLAETTSLVLRATTIVALGAVLASSSCSGGGGGMAARRSSTLTVVAMPGGQFALTDAMTVAVGGGALAVQTARFHVAKVEIEENTGESGGENNEEGEASRSEVEGSEGNEGGENEGGESDVEDIVIVGPFSFDIADGAAVLQSVAVFPGTFRRAELTLSIDPQPPPDDHSIVVVGEFQPSSGAPIPVTLRSSLLGKLEVPIANGGIVVASNTTVSIALTFDLAAMFGTLDFASAVVEGGEILIDAAHNAPLLAVFEANVGNSVEVEENDG